MNTEPTLAHPTSLLITLSATLATVVALGLLTSVAFLFQRDGTPLEHFAAAERACTRYVYVSERQACMREWLSLARASNVASN